MRWWIVVAVGLAASGCADPDPAWAVDPILVTPTDGGMRGVQTWHLYRARWERSRSENTYVCAVAVDLEGAETPCTDCQLAWATTATLASSDCGPTIEADPTWVSLERLALGPVLDAADGPVHAGVSSSSFADYGWGWEVHGQAWPEALDHGGAATSGTWDGVQVFTFEPELAWPLAAP